jgi:hypothetical protein
MSFDQPGAQCVVLPLSLSPGPAATRSRQAGRRYCRPVLRSHANPTAYSSYRDASTTVVVMSDRSNGCKDTHTMLYAESHARVATTRVKGDKRFPATGASAPCFRSRFGAARYRGACGRPAL